MSKNSVKKSFRMGTLATPVSCMGVARVSLRIESLIHYFMADLIMVNVRWRRTGGPPGITIEFTIPEPNANFGLKEGGRSYTVAKETATILRERLGFTFNVYRPIKTMNPRWSKNCSVSIKENIVTVRIPDLAKVHKENKKSTTVACFQHRFHDSVVGASFYFRK